MLPQIPSPPLAPDIRRNTFRHSEVWEKLVAFLAISSAHLLKYRLFHEITLQYAKIPCNSITSGWL